MAMAAVATARSTSTVVTHPGPARWAMSTAFQVVAGADLQKVVRHGVAYSPG